MFEDQDQDQYKAKLNIEIKLSLSGMLETFPDAMFVIDKNKKIILINNLVEELFGYARQELINSCVSILLPEKQRDIHDQIVKKFFTSPQSTPIGLKDKSFSIVFSGLKKNDEEFPVDFSLNPLTLNGTIFMLAGIRDMSKELNIEQTLQETTAELSKNLSLTVAAKQYAVQMEHFIDTLCHELRNPLNGIYGGVQSLQNSLESLKPLLREDQLELFQEITEKTEIITKCAEQQKTIVDDVLTLSKLENHKLELDIIPFELIETIQNISKIFLIQIAQKNLRLVINIPTDHLWIKGDPRQLSQVIINLISNAIKFTEHGTITLMVSIEETFAPTENAVINFIVKDTGVGLLPNEIDNLFQRFGQANIRTGAEYGGSGLGLIISKQIIELMGGTIQIESQKWEGSQFSFTIRCSRLTEQEQLEAIRRKKSLDKLSKIQIPQLNGKKILIVEDNNINIKVLISLLKPTNCICCQAQDGESALEQYERNRFDLIFMDIGLPNMSGLEVAKLIREKELLLGYHTPIIGLSGFSNDKTRNQALQESGMDAFLTKPYIQRQLFETMVKYLLLKG